MIIKTAAYVSSVVSSDRYPKDVKSEFLLSGRSNVGKSSFINTILGRNGIAKISSKPGKTQTLNFYIVNDEFYLVDVPGYGYAKVNKKVREQFGAMIEEYLLQREQLKVVFLLVDYRHAPSKDDCLMYDFLAYHNINIVVVATKSDKISKNLRFTQDKLIKDAFGSQVDIIHFSSVTGEGREEVLSRIEELI